MLVVVSGPSGGGKSTLIHRVLRETPGLRFSVSHTTRPRRASERDGRDYHFVSPAVFQRMIARGAFLEWAWVHGHLYGTSRAEVRGRRGDVLLDIDVQGARQVRAALGTAGGAVFVFVTPPSFRVLARRLRARGEDVAAAVARRLRNARDEMRAAAEFDYAVINDDLETAVAELKAIVLAARCRTAVRKTRLKTIIRSFGR
jgi:guanylate kinase